MLKPGRGRESFSEKPLSMWLAADTMNREVQRKRLPPPFGCGPAALPTEAFRQPGPPVEKKRKTHRMTGFSRIAGECKLAIATPTYLLGLSCQERSLS
jgi:hypothetical protein